MKIRISAITDKGKEREINQDAFTLCPDLSKPDWTIGCMEKYMPLGNFGTLVVVADGMGGANAGEVASALAVETAAKYFNVEELPKAISSKDKVKEFMMGYFKAADTAIENQVWDCPHQAGMGTTIVLCWILGTTAHIAWCGDSRCYVFNPKTGLTPLTKDHSYVQELIDKGEITEEEAFTHPDNNIITRGLGDIDFSAEPDYLEYEVKTSDTFLLCSDGLCGYCPNSLIEKTLYENYGDIVACQEILLQHALNAGGYDNICIAMASAIADNEDCPRPLSFWQKFMLRFR